MKFKFIIDEELKSNPRDGVMLGEITNMCLHENRQVEKNAKILFHSLHSLLAMKKYSQKYMCFDSQNFITISIV